MRQKRALLKIGFILLMTLGVFVFVGNVFAQDAQNLQNEEASPYKPKDNKDKDKKEAEINLKLTQPQPLLPSRS